jgi:hypothetical protein
MARRALPENYTHMFGIRTTQETKELIDQLCFKMMTDKGAYLSKSEAFAAVIAKAAKVEHIGA